MLIKFCSDPYRSPTIDTTLHDIQI